MDSYFSMALAAFGAGTLAPMVSEAWLATLLATSGKNPYALWAVATAANSAGSAFNWTLGRFCLHWQDRRWFPISAEKLARASAWFGRFGLPSLLFSWLPLVGDPLTFAAGTLRVPFLPFLALVVIGKGTRYALIAAGVLSLT